MAIIGSLIWGYRNVRVEVHSGGFKSLIVDIN